MPGGPLEVGYGVSYLSIAIPVHVHLPLRLSKKHPPTFFFFFSFFSKKFLLRFWVFLGMGGSKTAKKLFWKFFGHDPKSHLMTQKIFF